MPFGESMASRATADHFFGRAKAEESASTVWLLRWDHHEAKGRNAPSAETWTRKFILCLCRRADSWVDADFVALDKALARLSTQKFKQSNAGQPAGQESNGNAR